MKQLNRRSFIATASGGVAALAAACADATAPDLREPNARLTSRRRTPFVPPVYGLSSLGLTDQITGRDGQMYVPPGYNAKVAAPLLLCLHGANGSGLSWANAGWLALMDEFNIVMLAPDSRAFDIWDLLLWGQYGADVTFIDEALATVFRAINIDARRIAIAGFSAGASETLGLGILNGDFFKGVIGFSPGTMYAPFARGHTRVFVSHGDEDDALPYPNTRDVIVPAIDALGVQVQFESFSGGHEIPVTVARAALTYAL